MKLMAVDVGFVATGVAILERKIDGDWQLCELHTIKPDSAKKHGVRKSDSDIERVVALGRGISELIDRHALLRAVVELPHGGARNGRAMRCMALASGMIATVLDQNAVAVEWFSPRETRIAAVGRPNNVPKEEVIKAMARKFKLAEPQLNEHTADALATYIAAQHGNLVKL